MAQGKANVLFDGLCKLGGTPVIEIGGRVGVGAGLLDHIANEVLGVVAERAVGLGAEGAERVASPGLEQLLVEAVFFFTTVPFFFETRFLYGKIQDFLTIW